MLDEEWNGTETLQASKLNITVCIALYALTIAIYWDRKVIISKHNTVDRQTSAIIKGYTP